MLPPPHVWFDTRELSDRLLDQRVVLAHGRLDDESVTRLCAQLLTLDAAGTQPIRLELHSLDAELPAALTLMGVLEVIRGPVSAYVSGLVRGPALGIVAVADHRYAYPSTVLVLCEPRLHLVGGAAEIAAQRSQAEAMLAELAAALAEVTGRDVDQIRADITHERLLTVDAAIDYGLIEGRVEASTPGRNAARTDPDSARGK